MRKTILAVLAFAVLGVAGCAAEPEQPPSAPADPPAAPAEPSAEATSAEATSAGQVYRFAVAGGKRTGGPDTVTADVGTEVTIEVITDAPDELHVHGYDKAVDCVPGQPAKVTFRADVPGIFEVELHESGPLTQLRVGA